MENKEWDLDILIPDLIKFDSWEQLPRYVEFEYILLGNLAFKRNDREKILAKIKPEYFYLEWNKSLFILLKSVPKNSTNICAAFGVME